MKDYYKGLIAIRKQIPAFRDQTASSLNTICRVTGDQEHLIAYTIQNGQNGSDWETVAVIANAAFKDQMVELPADRGTGKWAVLADGTRAGVTALDTIHGNTVTVPAQTGMILISVAEGSGDFQKQSTAAETGGFRIRSVQSNVSVFTGPDLRYSKPFLTICAVAFGRGTAGFRTQRGAGDAPQCPSGRFG